MSDLFDEKQVSKYRNIKAPDTLKAGILDEIGNVGAQNLKAKTPYGRKNIYKAFSAVAAGLVLVLTLSLSGGLRTDITLNAFGTEIGEKAFEYSSPEAAMMTLDRALEPEFEPYIPITVLSDKPLRIKSVGGEMILTDKNGITSESVGNATKTEPTDGESYYVIVPERNTEAVELQISRGLTHETYIIEIDYENQNYKIYKTEK